MEKQIDTIDNGKKKMEWADKHMPVLNLIRRTFIEKQPFKNIKISMALHIEAKTAILAKTLMLGGAKIAITGCNPLSTQNDIVESLNTEKNIYCYAHHDCSQYEYHEYLNKVLDFEPDIIIDDGADLISLIHNERRSLLSCINGCCEETTTGITRVNAMLKSKNLETGIFAVNNANTKHLFDNRYGTGQSVLDSIMSTTNILIAGKNIVISGYGWCGKGVAMRASGMGGIVFITEINPFKALEANMDGYCVISMDEACKIGDIFITTTGNCDIITSSHFKNMKNEAILANAGHFNVEINVSDLEILALSKRKVRNNIEEYSLENKKLYLISQGRLVNLAAGNGHPIEVMDLSFSNQALCSEYLAAHKLEKGVYPVPSFIDEYIANLKLKSMGIKIDTLSEKQKLYLNSWISET